MHQLCWRLACLLCYLLNHVARHSMAAVGSMGSLDRRHHYSRYDRPRCWHHKIAALDCTFAMNASSALTVRAHRPQTPAIAVAPMMPIPGMVSSRLLAGFARCCILIRFSSDPISICSALSCAASKARVACASTGKRASLSSATIASNSVTCPCSKSELTQLGGDKACRRANLTRLDAHSDDADRRPRGRQ
jgi:hypothetical protein